MTSQTEKKINAILILPYISRSKGSQTTKFGQLMKYNLKEIFFSKIMRKMKQGDELFLFFKKALYEIKASGHDPSFNKFW